MRRNPALAFLLPFLCVPVPPAAAACATTTGFAVFQCGDRAWFQPPPEGSGGVEAVFWQIGFGNATVANGKGSSGTGIAPAGVFNGNDSGLARLEMVSARDLLGREAVPPGALCLGTANWANRGVDGCCDNLRDLSKPRPDGFLNPYFDTRRLAADGAMEPSLAFVQDYPMAVLLTEETGRWFAVAAVGAAFRGGDAGDLRPGHFSLADVSDGEENPLTGRRNLIPWQRVPAIRLSVEGPGLPEAGGEGAWNVLARWDPVRVHSDGSRLPSEGYQIDTPGGGVGVADMGPLVHYVVERARILPPMLEGGAPDPDLIAWEPVTETDGTQASIVLQEDACARLSVRFGTRPRTRSVSARLCAVGQCGDVGFVVTGPPACLEGPVLRASGQPGP